MDSTAVGLYGTVQYESSVVCVCCCTLLFCARRSIPLLRTVCCQSVACSLVCSCADSRSYAFGERRRGSRLLRSGLSLTAAYSRSYVPTAAAYPRSLQH